MQPLLTTRSLTLTLPQDADLGALYEISVSGANLQSWRFRTTSPSPEHFVQSFWAGVLTQLVVRDLDSGATIGLVVAYDATPLHCKLGVIGAPDTRSTGVMVEATVAFVDYLFSNWPIRKIYFEMEESRLEAVPSIRLLAVEEGRFQEHLFANGEYCSLVILSLFRESWLSWAEKFSPLRQPAEPAG